MSCRPIQRSVIFRGLTVPTPPRRVRVRVAVVVVPDGADVAWVGFEQEAGHGVDPAGRRAADRTRRGSGRFRHRPLPLVHRAACGALVVVLRHLSEARSAPGLSSRMLAPARLVHHLFHGEGGDPTQHRLAQRTAEDIADAATLLGLRLRMGLRLWRLTLAWTRFRLWRAAE